MIKVLYAVVLLLAMGGQSLASEIGWNFVGHTPQDGHTFLPAYYELVGASYEFWLLSGPGCHMRGTITITGPGDFGTKQDVKDFDLGWNGVYGTVNPYYYNAFDDLGEYTVVYKLEKKEFSTGSWIYVDSGTFNFSVENPEY